MEKQGYWMNEMPIADITDGPDVRYTVENTYVDERFDGLDAYEVEELLVKWLEEDGYEWQDGEDWRSYRWADYAPGYMVYRQDEEDGAVFNETYGIELVGWNAYGHDELGVGTWVQGYKPTASLEDVVADVLAGGLDGYASVAAIIGDGEFVVAEVMADGKAYDGAGAELGADAIRLHDPMENADVEARVLLATITDDMRTWSLVEHDGLTFAVVLNPDGSMFCQSDWQGETATPDAIGEFNWVECTRS